MCYYRFNTKVAHINWVLKYQPVNMTVSQSLYEPVGTVEADVFDFARQIAVFKCPQHGERS